MRFVRFAFIVGILAAVGCGGQDVDSGSSTNGGGGATGGTGGAQAAVADVRLTYGGASATVDLATLATQDYKGTAVVSLATVWAAGKLHADTSSLQFDFEGDDGFHPSNKASCAAYVAGAQIARGYILPDTRTLVWDDALGFPGCYSVKAVATVIGLDVIQ
jgi:hypothetical protein